MDHRPAFEDLPLHPDHPPYSAWGLWGPQDELGALNLITPEVTKAAAAEIQLGVAIPLDEPDPPLHKMRKALEHTIVAKGFANDDYLTMNTQTSSQWDSLRHYPYQNGKFFYNGVVQADIDTSNRNGIQNLANKGLATRGVLLDWRSYAVEKGIDQSPFEKHAIPLRELLEVARLQNVTFKPGDLLIVRTGFTEAYRSLTPDERAALARSESVQYIGVEPTRELAKWHWDMQFAAVASDTYAYESNPVAPDWGLKLHEVFMAGWGLPIGEMWDLEALAAKCKEIGRWSFFITSQPLHLDGGVASPPNAMAIL